jgi:hypothetical protein
MNFLDYIKGNRKGADAHRTEKESMKDPFMYEALEGFDNIESNHAERIDYIYKRLNLSDRTTKDKKRFHRMWQISAACAAAVVIFVTGGYFYKANYQANLYAENTNTISQNDIIKVYVPEDYYTENVVAIARHNVEAVKAYKPGFKNVRANIQETRTEEVNISAESEKTLNVYIPG